MTERIEFGSKDAADNIREQHSEYLSSDDDRRLKTVELVGEIPDAVLEQIRIEAQESRAETAKSEGQIGLSDSERDRIDFSKGRASVPHAQSVKGIARAYSVDDWLSHYDPQLTVDEHRDVMADARDDDRGKRRESDRLDKRRRDAARTAQAEGCDHAAGHCENGDPEACEYLAEVCGYDENEVSELIDDRPAGETEQRDLVTVGGEGTPFVEMAVTSQEAGALRDSWTGYKAGIGNLEDALDTVREAVTNARQAFATVNRIRRENGEEELHPDRLHELLDSLRDMPESIPETRTLDHFGATRQPSNPEDVTPMSEVTEEQLRQRAPSRPDPTEMRPDVIDDGDDSDEDTDADTEQFATEKQGSLDVGVEQAEKKDEGQATLTGEPATAQNAALPAGWTRKGTVWRAGPYKVMLDSHDGDIWSVRLIGPDNSTDIATDLPTAEMADDIAVEFTDRIAPDDVSFRNRDAETQTAIAEAKKAVLEGTNRGLGRFAEA